MKKLARNTARKIKRMVMPDSRVPLLMKMPQGAVCAEIGVWKGEFSDVIYKVTKPSEFHLIDPWLFQSEFPDRMYGGRIAKEQQDMDAIHDNVEKRLGSKPGVKIHREKSDEALTKFQDNYFDWIYIDGNHYYEYVLKDLQLSYQKVKPGGHIVGDDYKWGSGMGFPVKKAVADFMEEANIPPEEFRLMKDQFIITKPMA